MQSYGPASTPSFASDVGGETDEAVALTVGPGELVSALGLGASDVSGCTFR